MAVVVAGSLLYWIFFVSEVITNEEEMLEKEKKITMMQEEALDCSALHALFHWEVEEKDASWTLKSDGN